MNEISVSDRKSTNNIAEFSIKDEKNYIVNVRKCFFITPDMKYAYMRALSAPFSLRRDRETLRRCIIRGIT